MTTECRCTLSDLLERSIELIDPSPPSRNPPNDSDHDDVLAAPATFPVSHHAPDVDVDADAAVVADNDSAIEVAKVEDKDDRRPTHGSEASLHKSNIEKKVRFSKSCRPSKASISAIDARRAYELLMHAESFISLSFPSPSSTDRVTINDNDKCDTTTMQYIESSSSWETLNDVADIYRALLVTACLLMELLPAASDTTATSCLENDAPSNKTETYSPLGQYQYSTLHHHNCCPLLRKLDYDDSQQFIPTFTPSIMNELLSTSRRCIQQLQSMERICAIKTISERLYSQSNASSSNSWVSLHHEGGDDIHDYERPIVDWYANYDWHDDGFLPLPFFHHTVNINNNHGVTSSISCNNIYSQSNLIPHSTIVDDKTKSNILYECCYRPHYHTDPPSSRYEKVAWTRDWIRGERIVSLRMEDYQCCDEKELHREGSVDDLNYSGADDEGHTTEINSFGGCIDDSNSSDEENLSLDISSAVLAEEESCLIDVMLAGEAPCPSSNNGHKKRAVSIKEVRRKKRLKLKQKKELQQRGAVTIATEQTVQSSICGKEGFLLLVREETTSGSLPQLFVDTIATSIRVFVRLHPSGWLSIEDRSIRRQDCLVDTDKVHSGPLVPRARYFDFLIDPETTCQPWVRNGVTSFHFRLHNLHFLGASSLQQLPSDDHDSNIESHSFERVELLFCVDDETGGDFADGFEWVNCASILVPPLEENSSG